MFPAEIFGKTIGKVVVVLNRHAIRYHLTGGITSILYGEPRFTQDVDIVVDPISSRLRQKEILSDLISQDFHLNLLEASRAIEQGEMFQLFDSEEALKIDIYVRELIPGELSRSVKAVLFEGTELSFVCPEDAVLSKLIWISRGSQKSRRDFRKAYVMASEKSRVLIAARAAEMQLDLLMSEILAEPDELS